MLKGETYYGKLLVKEVQRILADEGIEKVIEPKPIKGKAKDVTNIEKKKRDPKPKATSGKKAPKK